MNFTPASCHRTVRALCATSVLAALPAAAQFVNPVATSVGIDAAAVNSYIQPGVSRNTNGTGPLLDSAAEIFGSSTADASAAVDGLGLHASSSVHGEASINGYSASARSYASLVNPFILRPQAGFVGTQALLRIPYSFGGSINIFPSLAACSTCFGQVQASLGVDGMTDQFYFLGSSSQGTAGNPNFFVGGVARGGVLEGLVPVDTELYLRAGLLTQVHCQAFLEPCGTAALFGGTLSYTGFSTDAVDIVWGLAPQAVAAVPEPSALLLMVAGLAAMVQGGQRRSRVQRLS